MLFQLCHDQALGSSFVPFFNRNQKERNAIELGDGLAVAVIGNDARNVTGKLARMVPIQKINEAMVVSGNHDGHALANVSKRQSPLHLEILCSLAELPGEVAE